MATIAGKSQERDSCLVQMDHDYMLLFQWLCQWLRQWQHLSREKRVSSVFFELQQGMALIKHLATWEERDYWPDSIFYKVIEGMQSSQMYLWLRIAWRKPPPPPFTKPIKDVNKSHHILTSDMECSWTELSSWDEQFTVSITFPLSLLE